MLGQLIGALAGMVLQNAGDSKNDNGLISEVISLATKSKKQNTKQSKPDVLKNDNPSLNTQ